MKTAIVQIEGVGAISFSRRHEVPELEGESRAAYDRRTWREKLHYDTKTHEVFIPGIQLKKALDYTAKQIGLQIPGRGKKTWASIFESGVLCPDRVMLGIKRDDVTELPLFVNSKGQKGGSLDIMRIFPLIEEWAGTATFLILNDMIDERIFRLHLTKAGQFCGLGRYAPRKGGHHGRFVVKDVLWQDEALEAA